MNIVLFLDIFSNNLKDITVLNFMFVYVFTARTHLDYNVMYKRSGRDIYFEAYPVGVCFGVHVGVAYYVNK